MTPQAEDPAISKVYTLNEAKRLTGESRNLITFLVTERSIPTQTVGMAKVLDESGMKSLRQAIADYRKKAETVPV